MADQYITSEYCSHRFGDDLKIALTSRLGTTLEKAIESATVAVKLALTRHGFTPPAITTDQLIQSATFAALWQALADMPKASVKLPENWETNQFRVALMSIEDGSASKYLAEVAGLSLDTATGVGGSLWTDRTSTSSDPRRTSNDELAGF